VLIRAHELFRALTSGKKFIGLRSMEPDRCDFKFHDSQVPQIFFLDGGERRNDIERSIGGSNIHQNGKVASQCRLVYALPAPLPSC